MGLTFTEIEKRIIPILVCDSCGERLYSGNGLVVWNEEYDIKFICKGVEKCDKFPTYIYSDMIEHHFFMLCYNSRMGTLKRTKRSLRYGKF